MGINIEILWLVTNESPEKKIERYLEHKMRNTVHKIQVLNSTLQALLRTKQCLNFLSKHKAADHFVQVFVVMPEDSA